MKTQWASQIAFAGSLLLTWAAAFGSGGAGSPPVFTNLSPESTIVYINLGQTSFECTGSAFDYDVSDIVDFATVGRPSFIKFETVPGNPASFRIFGDQLNLAQFGAYRVDVVAFDNASPPSISVASFGIGIVPEPANVSTALVMLFFRRNRR